MTSRTKLASLLATTLFFGTAACAALALSASSAGAQDAPAPAPAPAPEKPADAPADKPAGDDARTREPRKAETAERLPESAVTEKINEMLAAKWKEKGLTPSEPASDLEWFRRVSIDMIGRSPNLEETEAFMASKIRAKRKETVDRLLETEDFAKNSARFWMKALISNGGMDQRIGDRMLTNYLRDAVGKNLPYNTMVKDILTAEGEANIRDRSESSPLGYFITFRNEVENITGNVSRAFLGVEIQCVQCHDDKLGERWNQNDFRQLAAVFAFTRSNRTTRDKGSTEYDTYDVRDQPVPKRRAGPVADKIRKEAEDRIKKQNPEAAMRLGYREIDPKPPGSDKVIEGKDGLERRKAFAEWVTSNPNNWFARTAVNRVWANYLKRGFADPVDDFSSTNTPSYPELLDYIARDFVANGYDLKRLTRIIVNTRAYQLSSKAKKGNKDDMMFYSRAYIDQLGAEPLLDSIISATSLDRAMGRLGDGRGLERLRDQLLRGFRFIFEDDEGKDKETFTGTIPQALLMMNGEFIDKAISGTTPGSALSNILKTTQKLDERVRLMYLAVLTREPDKKEMARMVASIVEEGGGSLAAYEDVFWALLNSAEFLNNH
jgi:hypothetical protein